MAQITDGSETAAPGDGRSSASATRRRLLILGIPVLVAGAIAGLTYWSHARQFESTDDAFVDARIVFVAPQVAGIVQTLPVIADQHVSPGDLLAVINPDITETLLRQQEAGTSQAESVADQARASVAAAESRLAQARTAVAGRQADLDQAAIELDRLEALRRADPGAVAPAQLDAARTSLADARAALENADRAVDGAQADVVAARAASDAALAQSQAADARVQQARITVGQTRITAPLSGHLANISVNLGSYVAPGMHMMALIPDELWITANFKETQISRIRPGQTVDIRIDAFPQVPFEGRVLSIQRAAGQAFDLLPSQNATGNFVKVVQTVPVRISIISPDPTRYPIGPGMSAVPKVRVLPDSTSD